MGVDIDKIAARTFASHLLRTLFDVDTHTLGDDRRRHFESLFRGELSPFAGENWTFLRQFTPFGRQYYFSVGVNMVRPEIVELIPPDKEVEDLGSAKK